MKNTGKVFLFIIIIATILSACNKSANIQTAEKGEVESDSARYERLRLKEEERLAKIENSMEKVYLCSDTIPFGDLSIIINKVESRKIQTDELAQKMNKLKGNSDMRTATLSVTFINNGQQNVELPYTSFAKERKSKDRRNKTNTVSRGQDGDNFHIASRLMLDKKSNRIVENMTLKPGEKLQVVYISVLNKTPQWLLRFTNEHQVMDTTTTTGKQIQKSLDRSGMGASVVTDDYDGTSAYVDLNEVL